jgi:class 3 adenylate cyclase
MTAATPSGVVTFLFTDVEGSTRRWENDADAMRAALAAHDEWGVVPNLTHRGASNGRRPLIRGMWWPDAG